MQHPRKLAKLFRALSVESRVKIVQLLKTRSFCVSALAARLDMTPAAVSQHLRIMRDADLVVDQKQGYYVHYHLNEKTLAAWRGDVDRLLAPSPGTGKCRKGVSQCLTAARNSKAVRKAKI